MWQCLYSFVSVHIWYYATIRWFLDYRGLVSALVVCWPVLLTGVAEGNFCSFVSAYVCAWARWHKVRVRQQMVVSCGSVLDWMIVAGACRRRSIKGAGALEGGTGALKLKIPPPSPAGWAKANCATFFR